MLPAHGRFSPKGDFYIQEKHTSLMTDPNAEPVVQNTPPTFGEDYGVNIADEKVRAHVRISRSRLYD